MHDSTKILCLYSGGTDSTLAAAIAAEKADTVYLVTYERFGLFASKRANKNLLALRNRYPDTEFVHGIENFEKEYKKMAYECCLADGFGNDFIGLSVCGSCKLGMHFKTITGTEIYQLTAIDNRTLMKHERTVLPEPANAELSIDRQ